ncbi:MAG TPA: branched-chain amino acid ABC transporter permease [Tepidisphaeraceae bacterium]|jgi:branched-chain amino acid transport system permease protein|nr:branched-chain amino acid ABC transporter permease [Tepidisphaeraceae bacterium]
MTDTLPLSRSSIPRPLRTMLDNGLLLVLIVVAVLVGRLVDNEELVDPYRANVILRIGITIVLAVSLQLINGISGQFSLGHAGFMAVGAYLGGYATLAYGAATNADDETIDFQRPAAMAGFFACLILCAVVAAAVLYGLFALIRLSRRLHGSLPPLLLLAALAWLVWDISKAYPLETVPAYLVWSRGFAGLNGLFSWMIEAMQSPTGRIDGLLPTAAREPLAMFMSLLGGGVCAAMVGFIVGLPTLRLRGDYLAIATLGFAAIINVVIFNTQALGGAIGLQVPTYFAMNDDDVPIRFIAPWVFAAVIITTAVVWRLARSPKGRAIVAVREDEIAAAATGIDVTHHKVLAFVVGSFFAGVAGALFAHLYGYINTGSFELVRSIELVIIVTIGGLGSIPGAIIAAIVLTWLPEFLRDPTSWLALFARPFGVASADELNLSPWLTDRLAQVGDYRLVIYALLLILIMIARAKTGNRNWLPRRRPRPAAAAPVATGQSLP